MYNYHVSDAQAAAAALVAIGLSAQRADRLAAAFPGLRGLAAASEPQIRAACGCTERQASRVRAAFLLGAIAATQARDGNERAMSPCMMATRIRRLLGSETAECFAVVLLDPRQRVIDLVVIARGSVAKVEVHPREVFRPAIQSGAHSVVLAHNHPSGDPQPSVADFELTDRFVQAGRLTGIPVVDHIVVTADAHVSMAAEGILG